MKCPECGARREQMQGFTMIVHAKGCARGWSNVSTDEFESAKAHQESRDWSEQAMERDHAQLKERGEA